MRAKLFRDVPFARDGWQHYHADEIEAGNGIVPVYRPPEEVKRSAETFNGVPVTMEHPDDMLAPDTAEGSMVGIVSSPTYKGGQVRGDLMIWHPEAITAIASGMRELSGGYRAEYQQTDRGVVQTNIRGNHVALVPRGRSGSAQRIGA